MQLFNSRTRYGLVAILFHWVMAILLIFLCILGLYMTRIPISLLKLKLYGWHKELGMLALFLVIVRLLWKAINVNPLYSPVIPKFDQYSAIFVHWIFYFLMIFIPISGWLVTSAAGLPASFFGLFLMPDLIAPSETKRFFYTQIHNWMGYILMAFICLHTYAALKHHFVNKDDILRRML